MINLKYKGTAEGLLDYLDLEQDRLEMERQGDLEDLQRDNDLDR